MREPGPPPLLVLRCCRDWPLEPRELARDLCPLCGMHRKVVEIPRQP